MLLLANGSAWASPCVKRTLVTWRSVARRWAASSMGKVRSMPTAVRRKPRGRLSPATIFYALWRLKKGDGNHDLLNGRAARASSVAGKIRAEHAASLQSCQALHGRAGCAADV